jgi:transposase
MLPQQADFIQRAMRLFPSVTSFLDAALPALAVICGSGGRGRPPTHRPERILAAIWTLGRTGGQWRSIEVMTGIPFTTVYHHFCRLTRLGFWKRLAHGLIGLLRHWIGSDPTVGSADSQSIPSTPSCGVRGIDAAKKIKGIRLTLVVDRNSMPLALRTDSLCVGERAALENMIDPLADDWPSVETLLADIGYCGKDFAARLRARGVKLQTVKCGGSDGKFRPSEIRWTVERAFAWVQSWRRTAVCYERDLRHFEAFVYIVFASIAASLLSDIGALPSVAST